MREGNLGRHPVATPGAGSSMDRPLQEGDALVHADDPLSLVVGSHGGGPTSVIENFDLQKAVVESNVDFG